MGDSPSARREGQEQRPTLLLVVFAWDMVSALLAVFEALAPFAGGVAVGAQQQEIPLGIQVLGALAPAAYGTALIILASLITRRQRWIQRTQIGTLALAVALQGVALVIAVFRGGVDIVPVLTTLLIVLLNIMAIVVMTERRVSAWYTESAPTPRYMTGTLGFWLATDAALLVIAAVR
ncbi:MAG: hypothetical protein JOZ46_09190 [Candidatus Dormibacteraeota bacterium]|nr:hypothetical protein [Candidatus Dormibacteraeota bacterium]MBV9525972.1 hypothetical protein [Candidatus Dormibacteraeota bacterium]